MPYYIWTGINLAARIVRGTAFARSQELLDKQLFSQDIALLTARPVRWIPAFLYPVKESIKVDFFRHLAVLINSGVHMHKALYTLTIQAGFNRFSTCVEELAQAVERGTSLSEALALQKSIFEPIAVQICAVGEESNLLQAVSLLVTYLEERQAFKKRLRAAIAGPLITFCFFIVILLLMFTIVIPQFATMLESMNASLPSVTQALFAISNNIISLAGVYSIILLFISSGLLLLLRRVRSFKRFYHMLIVYAPYFGQISIERNLTLFFSSLGTMVQAGVPLTRALSVASGTVTNIYLREYILLMQNQVEQGELLSAVFNKQRFIRPDINALIVVGEETGSLGALLQRAGRLCNERLTARLLFFTTIIQPLLLIILALAIVILMMAVYLPILSLSQLVH